MTVKRAGLVVAAAVASLAGCGTDLPPAGAISGLHFTTSTEIASNPPLMVDVTLTNATAAENIYTATLALPDFSPGGYSCPNDDGVRYAIAFMNGQSVAVTATLSPTGCREVTISGSATRRVLDGAYWTTLAQNLGIAEATFFPPPNPN